MTSERQETRAEEIARVRSYLASQSVRRTPLQLVDTLREAHQQFLSALATIPDTQSRVIPRAGEWSALDVLLHVRTMAAFDLSSITTVLERDEQPPDIQDAIITAPAEVTRKTLLSELNHFRNQLFTLVQHADTNKSLTITWSHPEFGAMHWREWMLFARVHTLDHARQLQAIGDALATQHTQEKGTEA